MTIFEITAILDYHKVRNQVTNGHVLAKQRSDFRWIDVTNWSRIEMAHWLGC